ncbi:MAG: hypothetical protein J1E37_06595 [Prevotella sp.]|nr:hypothetical protein [Prevotella sp.]
MMLSDMCEIVSSFFSGLFSGLIATWIFWWYNNRYLSPKIKISDDIGFKQETKIVETTDIHGKKKKVKKTFTMYRIKISNESERDVYDIKINIRIRYNKTHATINVPYLPILYGKKDDNRFDYERELPFSLNDIGLARIESFKDSNMLDKYNKGKLEMSDFNDKDTLFEIILFATDSKSGASQRLTTRKHSYEELIASLKEGDFVLGKLMVGKGVQEAYNS